MELRAEALCKGYRGVPVLQNVTFTIGEGITCLMAPSGAGKTTLLRILLGLEQADSGTVSGGEKGRWAAVFQEDRLLEGLSAMENLRLTLGQDFDRDRAADLLARLGLGDGGDKPVRQFSGGMRRRVALARALLAPAELLALDEPFAGLDGETRSLCCGLIRRETAGKIVLLVTHDMEDAELLDAPVIRL